MNILRGLDHTVQITPVYVLNSFVTLVNQAITRCEIQCGTFSNNTPKLGIFITISKHQGEKVGSLNPDSFVTCAIILLNYWSHSNCE